MAHERTFEAQKYSKAVDASKTLAKNYADALAQPIICKAVTRQRRIVERASRLVLQNEVDEFFRRGQLSSMKSTTFIRDICSEGAR